MERIFIHNSLTGKKELFVPAYNGKVKIYTCGLTPQDYTHIGHAKLFVTFDVIRRIFEKAGYDVTYIVNFTDIDDKIIARSNASGEHPLFLAERFIESCLEDLMKLNVKPATLYPRATAHIIEIIEMVDNLVKNEFAYESNGNVYFRVKKFPDYGKLSGQSIKKLRQHIRIEPGEDKEDLVDFALWKKAKPGELSWNSPWGRGRPGWHIECSAMSIKYLGMSFDIHGGGQDLIFPHHENEIAQSEAYAGCGPFSRYFIHVGLLNLKASKMSKSLGNFIPLKDIFRSYDPMVTRLVLLKSHYRSPLDFYPELMEEGVEALIKLKEGLFSLSINVIKGSDEEGHSEDKNIVDLNNNFRDSFYASLYDDFNYAASLGHLFSFLGELSKIKGGSKKVFGEALELALGAFDIFGLQLDEDKGEEALIKIILRWREELRKMGEYTKADGLRAELEKEGFIIQDSPDGARFYRNPKRNPLR